MGRGTDWAKVRNLEDALAILAEAESRRRVIQTQAYHNGSHEQIFVEAAQMQNDLNRVKTYLSGGWHDITDLLQAGNKGSS